MALTPQTVDVHVTLNKDAPVPTVVKGRGDRYPVLVGHADCRRSQRPDKYGTNRILQPVVRKALAGHFAPDPFAETTLSNAKAATVASTFRIRRVIGEIEPLSRPWTRRRRRARGDPGDGRNRGFGHKVSSLGRTVLRLCGAVTSRLGFTTIALVGQGASATPRGAGAASTAAHGSRCTISQSTLWARGRTRSSESSPREGPNRG